MQQAFDQRHWRITIVLLLLLTLCQCAKEYSFEGRSNQPPIARAGTDQVVLLPIDSATLDGSASSDPDGSIVTYRWIRLSGTGGTITDSSSALTKLISLRAGDQVFQLTVTDNKGATAQDTVIIRVQVGATTTNRPPVARAGQDVTFMLPANSTTLDGTSSSDPDQDPLSYTWSRVSGPTTFQLAQPSSAITPLNNLVQGVYRFQLEVRDPGGLFSRDTVQVTVNAVPSLPAVLHITLTLPLDSVYIPDQDSLFGLAQGYRQVSGPSQANLRDSAYVTIARNLVPGHYEFRPVIERSSNASPYETIMIYVVNEPQDPNTITYHLIESLNAPQGSNLFYYGYRMQFNVDRNLRQQTARQLYVGEIHPNGFAIIWRLTPTLMGSNNPIEPYHNGDVGFSTPEWNVRWCMGVKVKMQ